MRSKLYSHYIYPVIVIEIAFHFSFELRKTFQWDIVAGIDIWSGIPKRSCGNRLLAAYFRREAAGIEGIEPSPSD